MEETRDTRNEGKQLDGFPEKILGLLDKMHTHKG